MNRPFQRLALGTAFLTAGLRKLGDSNPRYGNPHGSLANCWFQPLTQTSLTVSTVAFPLNCGAKVHDYFYTAKFFAVFLHNKEFYYLFTESYYYTVLYIVRLSHSFCHTAEDASEGIRQSPRGDRLTLPTFGPSGRHERLNC